MTSYFSFVIPTDYALKTVWPKTKLVYCVVYCCIDLVLLSISALPVAKFKTFTTHCYKHCARASGKRHTIYSTTVSYCRGLLQMTGYDLFCMTRWRLGGDYRQSKLHNGYITVCGYATMQMVVKPLQIERYTLVNINKQCCFMQHYCQFWRWNKLAWL